MLQLIEEKNVFVRLIEMMFPPQLGRMDDLQGTHEYVMRLSRHTDAREYKPGEAWGRAGHAQEKRVICLPGRVI
jgi:hypothetical protein